MSRLAGGVVVLGLVLTACSSSSPRGVWVSPSAFSESPAAQDVVLAFAGDVHFTGRTLGLLSNPQTAVGPFASVLRSADFAMVNLETAVTGRGTPQPKTYHFRAPKSAFPALKAAGIDLASVANNHTLDYGQIGLTDTLDSAREAGMPVVGAGRTAAEAYRPYVVTAGGTRLAIVAFSQVHELSSSWRATDTRPGIAMAFDLARATAAVRMARSMADVVIVFMHWGVEGNSCPSGEMKTFARRMAAAGAGIVIGTHAHVLLAGGHLGSTYVHFGLGNFVWYTSSHSTDTGVLRLTVRGKGVVRTEFMPGVVSSTGQPVPISGAAKQRLEGKLRQASGCTGLA